MGILVRGLSKDREHGTDTHFKLIQVPSLTCYSGERMLLPMTGVCDTLLGSVSFAGVLSDDLHAWKTAEHLNKASLTPPSGSSDSGDRSKSTFVEDESLPAQFRAKLQDYFRSGYDRGHMCVLSPMLELDFD